MPGPATEFSREEHLAALRLAVQQGRAWATNPNTIKAYAKAPELLQMKLRQTDVLTDLGKFLAAFPAAAWSDAHADDANTHADRGQDHQHAAPAR